MHSYARFKLKAFVEIQYCQEKYTSIKDGAFLLLVRKFCTSHKAKFKCHVYAGVDIDAMNDATKYTTKRK